MEKKIIPASELIINPDGTVFHLHLHPSQLTDRVILVGDPGRVDMVASFFDTVTFEVSSREFHTIGGTYHGKPIIEIVDFALTALFLYMLVMQIQNHLTLLVCLLASVLGVYFLVLTKNTIGLIIATLIASFVGFAIENTVRKHSKHPESNWFLSKLFRPKITKTTLEDKQAAEVKQQQKQEDEQHNED